MPLNGKVILITGGTGSFGKKFTEIVLAEHNPKAVRIFSRGEFLQMEMRKRCLSLLNSLLFCALSRKS